MYFIRGSNCQVEGGDKSINVNMASNSEMNELIKSNIGLKDREKLPVFNFILNIKKAI